MYLKRDKEKDGKKEYTGYISVNFTIVLIVYKKCALSNAKRSWYCVNYLVFLPFSQACAEGYFGNSCRFRCKCEATQACDHVTGHCISPTCQAGFTGPTCKHRKNAI